MKGTLYENLDPEYKYKEKEIKRVLRDVGLGDFEDKL